MTAAQATAKLVVYGPQTLVDMYPKDDPTIPANYANFGHIPYGQSLIGQIYFDKDNMDGCKKMDLETSHLGVNEQGEDYYQEEDTSANEAQEAEGSDFQFKQDAFATKIVLLDRGTCSFVTKVRNAERAGASLVVVIDDREENITNVIMGDDGTGMGIRIPAMLIGKDSGKILKDYAVTSDSKATLSAEFTIKNPHNYSDVEFWYSSNNILALDFLKEFDQYRHQLDTWMNFHPRFVTWACPSCTAEFKQDECFGNGKYCAPNTNRATSSFIQGKNIIMEDLRQLCLHATLSYEGHEPIWWDYMKYVHQECYQYISEECSQDAHKKIGVDFAQTQKCVDSSFDSGNEEMWKKDNKILRENAKQWTEYGVLYWPSITINQMTFRGNINPMNVLEAICASLWSQPAACMDFYQAESIQVPVNSHNSIVTAELLVGIVVLLIGVNAGLIYAYRRCAKKEMETDIGFQVSSAVAQYVAVSQDGNNTNPSNSESQEMGRV